MTTREEREARLRAAGYNLFNLHAEDVLIDLLTDSGTGAMAAEQWAAIQRGDESYAGSPSWFRFLESGAGALPVQARHPDPPGPRGREDPVHAWSAGPARSIPNNTHFDTTRANVEFTGAEARRPRHRRGPRSRHRRHPFKGNMDVEALERAHRERGAETCRSCS